MKKRKQGNERLYEEARGGGANSGAMVSKLVPCVCGKMGVGLLYIRRNDYGSIEATDVLIL